MASPPTTASSSRRAPSFELGRRNLFGKNRSANLFASVAEHLANVGDQNRLPTEYRLLGTFREPRLFDTAADAFVTATLQQVNRTSFTFTQASATASIARHLTRAISASVSYQIQKTDVFREQLGADQLLIDRVFPNVLLSSFSTSVIRDTRSDAVEPHAGQYVSANGQLAGRSDRLRRRLREIVLHRGDVSHTAAHERHRVRRRCAAGARDRIPAGGFRAARLSATCRRASASTPAATPRSAASRWIQLGVRHTPPLPTDTIDDNGFPKGGNALVILNAELRAPVWGGLGVVGFVDTGNVFARAVGHRSRRCCATAVGFGIRYKSPIGPIRIDLGFKVHPETSAQASAKG